MQGKKESLISKITSKLFKKKKVIQIHVVTEEEKVKLEQNCQTPRDEEIKTEHKKRLDRINDELWLSDLGG